MIEIVFYEFILTIFELSISRQEGEEPQCFSGKLF